ncbi:MAG: PAS domain S-box protein [Bacteroidales bacterium]
MNYQHQSKEELINELNKLHNDYESLKVLFENHINDSKSINENLDKTRIALSESENKYRNIVDYSTSIVLEWDTNGNIVFLNKYGLEFFGFTEDEIIGNNVIGTIVELYDSEGYDLEGKMKLVQKNPENFYSSENENIKKNGKKVWIAWTNKAIYNDDKKLIKTLSVGIDRTQQRKMEKELQIYRNQLEIKVNERSKELTEANQQLNIAKEKVEESEIRFKAISEQANDGISLADLNGKYIYVNQAFCKIVGYSELELLQMSVFDLKVPDDSNELFKRVIYQAQKSVSQKKLLRKDKSIITVEINSSVIEILDKKFVMGIVRDITKQIEVEVQLIFAKEKAEENEIRFKGMLDNLLDAFFQVDLDGNITFANHAALIIYGYSSLSEIIGKPAASLYAENKDRDELINDLRKFGKKTDWNVKGLRKDGSTFWASMNAQLIYDKNGNIIGTQGVIRDITNRKQIEDKLKKSQSLLKSIIDSTNDLIWSVDAEHFGLLNWNNSLHDYFLYDRGIVVCLGMTPVDLFPAGSEFISFWNDLYKQTIINGSHSLEYETITGKYILQLNLNLILNDDNVIGISIFAKNITEQKHNEVKMKLSEEKFRAAFMTIKDGFYIGTLAEGIIIDVNPGFKNIFQYSFDESIGKSSSELGLWAIPEDREMMVNLLKESGYCDNLETIGRKKNGELFNVSITAAIITINETLHIVGVIRDITKSKQAAKSLIESTSRFQDVLENSIDASYKRDLQTNTYEYLSPVFEKISGYTKHEMNTLPLEKVIEMIHPDDTPVINKIITEAISNPKVISYELSYRFKHKEKGSYFWILDKFTVIRNEKGEPAAMIGSVSDITERKQAEEALKASKDFLDKIINSVASPIFVKDDKHRFCLINNALCILLGLPAEKLIGNTGFEHFTKSQMDVFIAKDQEVFNTGKENINEEFIKDGNGIIRTILTTKTLYIDQLSNKFLVGVINDITAQKRFEKDLIIAKEKAEESDRLKTAFLNNISHEIRTPLNGILGFAPFVIDPEATPQEKEQYFKVLDKSCQRLINTVTDYIDMSLIVSGSMQVNPKHVDHYSLVETLNQRIITCCSEKNLEFNIQHSIIPEAVILKTDEELLMKALTHLLNNAIKFTPKGCITLGYEFINNELEFFVGDTGVGINNDVKKQVFNVFMQENVSNTRGYEGSGLGLSIASGIVKLLGGNIRLVSEKMLGTTVFVSLPIEQKKSIKEKDDVISKYRQNILPIVIIAEDDDLSFQYLEKIMSDISDVIVRAFNGKEVIEICKKNPAVNMVLMDIKMPLLNGYEATRQIRKFNKDVIIIAQTAYAQAGDKNKSIEAGCNDYISKPINKNELMALFSKYSNNS